MRKLFAIMILLLFPSPVWAAIDCSPLAPSPPKDTDIRINGKIDAKVGGLFAKLASGGATLDGAYREISHDVLSSFPNANRLYVWDRILYLDCQILSGATSLSDDQKLDRVQSLTLQFDSPPAESATPSKCSNTITGVGGNNNKIIQCGDGNHIDGN